MARRRRDLTPEDRRVWETVARTAHPLHPGAPEPARPPDPTPSSAAPRPVVRKPDLPRAAHPPHPDPQAVPERAHLQMDRRRYEKLRRGRLDPEARLDLHGMTAERAHAALIRFILQAHDAGLRTVLVITGKGRAAGDAAHPRQHGVLRHSVPHWLDLPPLGSRVLQVVSAHQRHGGGGALYVHLRRQR